MNGPPARRFGSAGPGSLSSFGREQAHRPRIRGSMLFVDFLPGFGRAPAIAVLAAVSGVLGVGCNAERAVLVADNRGAPGGAPARVTGDASPDAPGGIGGACAGHESCPPGAICQGGICAPCPGEPSCPAACPFAFSPILVDRNGCAICECAPRSECRSDADCHPAQICYAGVQCEDGCSEPECCFGNLCSAPGCPPAELGASCAVAGCHAGGQCLSNCARAACECRGGSWDCSGEVEPPDAGTLCIWACAAP
jgi:hypothetical protein